MKKQSLTPAAARVRRAFGVALWVGCAGFLNGCNGFSGDGPALGQQQRVGGEGLAVVSDRPAVSDRAELARAADKYVASATPGNAGYKIGPQDVLDIAVFKAPDLSKTVQVAEGGTINLPLVGEIGAAGKNATEIEHDLAAKLGAKYLKSPQVSVFVKEYNSQRITVEGAVKKPGVYAIRGHDTLLQSIAKADGLDRDYASSSVVIFRATDGGRSATRFDVTDIRNGRSEDPQVLAGDVIVVDDSMGKGAYQVLIKLLPLATPIMFFL